MIYFLLQFKNCYYRSSMHTEFRLILHTAASGAMYRIHEVTVNEKGEVAGISAPIVPEHESPETLTHILIHMLGALTKPVLDGKVFLSESSKSVDTAFDLIRPKNV